MSQDVDDQVENTEDAAESGSSLFSITVEEEEADSFDPKAYEATRSIITRLIEQLEDIKHKQKIKTEQLKDMTENNEALQGAEKQAKEATAAVKEIKTNIMQSSEAKTLKADLADLREEKKNFEESLSSHLFDLYQTTGVMEFETQAGDVYEYKIQAKLGSKKS